MQRRRLSAALLVLLSLLPTAVVAAAPDEASAVLLRSARMWEVRNRPDLQRLALEKYLLAHPGDAQAQRALGQLEIRSGRFEVATRLIEQIKAAAPASPVARDLADAYRLVTQDRLQMATVNRLLQMDRYPEAIAALNKLFPQGAPGGELGIEYYGIVGSSKLGWAEADRGLRQLVQDNPDDPKFVIALANHLTRRSETRADGLRLLAGLLNREDADRKQVLATWRSGLSRLPDDATALKPINEYLALNPDDGDVRGQLARVQEAERQRELKLRDPVYRLMTAAMSDLDAGRLADAERKLLGAQRLRPADAALAGNLGRLRLRQGRHAEAVSLFETAARGDAEERSKWSSLVRTARFWQRLRAADDATAKGNLDLARQQIRAALTQQPQDADALAALADNAHRRGDGAAAEKIFREALNREPTNGVALRGLSRLLSQTGRRTQALALLEALRKSHPKRAQTLDGVRAGLLRDEAEAALAAGRTGPALSGLEAAQAADPFDPWISFTLAKLYRQLGLPREARALMAAGVERAPENPEARYAYALLLSNMDDDAAAAEMLRQIPPERLSDSMRALQNRLQIAALRRKAFALASADNVAGAAALLGQAELAAGDEPELLEDVADAWMDIGQIPRALKLLQGWMRRQAPLTAADRMVWARALNRAEREPELAGVIAELRQDQTLQASDRTRLDEWQVASAIRQARALAVQRQYPAALALLAQQQRQHPANVRLLSTEADMYLAADDPARAIAIHRQLLQQLPDDTDTRLALVRALREAGQLDAAEREIALMIEDSTAENLPVRLSLARQLTEMQQLDRARKLVAELLERQPNHPDVLVQAGRIERADRKYEAALAFFRRAQLAQGSSASIEQMDQLPQQTAMPTALHLQFSDRLNIAWQKAQRKSALPQRDSAALRSLLLSSELDAQAQSAAAELLPLSRRQLLSAADEGVASIEQRRYGFVSAGYNSFGKSGDAGSSSYTASEFAIEVRVPQGYDGHWFALIDPGKAEAGTLPAVYDDAALYGKVQAFGPASLAAFPAGAEQSASGTGLGFGYETDDLRVDIGSTPLGFEVEDVVGGIEYGGEIGVLDFNLDLSRRPVTSSFLSYAGARDPVTGEVWGSVRSSGLDTRLAYYGPRHSVSASAGFHRLAGRNVPDNDFLSAGISTNWRVLDANNMRGFAGLALSWWNYAHNLSQYTFGHGGYYSPQSYVSLSLPLEWTGRWKRLAYELRASGSISRSRIDSALFYPGDEALQAQALAMPLPSGFSAPVYDGSSGTGRGYSLKAALEYQMTPHWYFGGHLDIDRSAFYSPNFMQVYLRYNFDARRQPVLFPPQPPRSYSRF